MARPHRYGFTLIELLVVITIIGMLMAIILPAIDQVTEAARRTSCLAKQEEIGKAMMLFQTSKDRFPGYNEMLTRSNNAAPVLVSWVATILDQLQERELYRSLKDGTANNESYISAIICPSNPPPSRDATLAYVVNTGMKDSGGSEEQPPDHEYNGVFHSRRQGVPHWNMTLEKIKDGVKSTLLLSENMQAGLWHNTEEQMVGMIWYAEETPRESRTINGDADRAVKDYEHARPSSRHPGGAVVAFCNGSCRYLSEDIDYLVYCKLMTPYGRKAKDPASGNAVPQAFWAPLDEAELDR